MINLWYFVTVVILVVEYGLVVSVSVLDKS